MKKQLFVFLLVGCCLATSLHAQENDLQPMKTADRIAMWKDSLRLKKNQIEKIWAIEREYNPEFDTVQFDGIFDAVRAREQTRQVKIQEVLTDKQRTRLALMEENERKANASSLGQKSMCKTTNGFPSYNTNPLPPDKTGMEHSAVEIAKRMGIGWNMGNSFESIRWGENGTALGATKFPGVSFETDWGNVKASKRISDGIFKAGFNVFRIPCAWDLYVVDTTTAKIQDFWLARVKEMVDSCLVHDMYVLLNIHLDGGWLEKNCTPEMQEINNRKQKAYWEQIATYFRDYDERLIFAGCNEPNVHNEVQMQVLASYEQTFVDAVRSTGGRNYYRTLIVQGPSTDIDETRRLFLGMPKDVVQDRLMFEVHYYTPWNFAGMEKDEDWGKEFYYWGEKNCNPKDLDRCSTYGDLKFMKEHFAIMKEMFADKGIPVILGEFACNRKKFDDPVVQKLHHQSRMDWLYEVTKNAFENGLIPVYWDNGYTTAPSMGVFDRVKGEVYDKEAVEVMMKATADAKKYWDK